MLRISQAIVDGTSWFRLEGNLAGPWVEECRAVCTRELAAGHALAIDATEVRFVDAVGAEFLRQQVDAGHLLESSHFVAELLRTESPATPHEPRRAPELQAGEELVRRYGVELVEFAGRLLGGELATAVAAAALLGAIDSPPSASTGDPLTWLKRLVVESARSQLAVEPDAAAIETLLPGFAADGAHLRPPTLRRLPDQDPAGITFVRQCIGELPQPYRGVLCLRDGEGLDVRTIAEWLGTSHQLARTLLHRARQALFALLQRGSALAGACC